MTRLASGIVYEFLEVADHLIGARTGRAAQQNARRQRAVSTAYYALFHAFSAVCAETSSGLDKTLYRRLGHSALNRALRTDDVSKLDPRLSAVEEAFKKLRETRENADYESPDFAVEPHEAFDLIEIAREAVAVLEAIDLATRRQLAKRLPAGSTARQTRS